MRGKFAAKLALRLDVTPGRFDNSFDSWRFLSIAYYIIPLSFALPIFSLNLLALAQHVASIWNNLRSCDVFFSYFIVSGDFPVHTPSLTIIRAKLSRQTVSGSILFKYTAYVCYWRG